MTSKKSHFVPRPEPTEVPTAAWNEMPLYCLKINGDWVSHVLGVLAALDRQDTWLGDEDQIYAARQQVAEIMLSLMTQCPPTMFNGMGDSVPEVVDSEDTGNLEIGAHFHVTTSGLVHGIRFYKSEANTGVHTGYLYDALCAHLWSVEFTDETASGWQEQLFPEPIHINACDDYLVTYSCPNGHYSKTEFGLSDGISSPPIIFENHDNGVYAYGSAPLCPNNVFNDSNYFVDIIFEATGE